MGMCGEDTAEKYSISREEQDDYARRLLVMEDTSLIRTPFLSPKPLYGQFYAT